MGAPRVVNGIAIFPFLRFGQRSTAMQRCWNFGRYRIDDANAERDKRRQHDISSQLAGRVAKALMLSRNSESSGVVICSEMRRAAAAPGRLDQFYCRDLTFTVKNSQRGFEHQLDHDRAFRKLVTRFDFGKDIGEIRDLGF
jgi:hypothetical protein